MVSKHINVAQQGRDPDSLMNWMERMIRMRKEYIGDATNTALRCNHPKRLGPLRVQRLRPNRL